MKALLNLRGFINYHALQIALGKFCKWSVMTEMWMYHTDGLTQLTGICPSIVSPSVHLYVHLFICPSVNLTFCLSFGMLYVCPSIQIKKMCFYGYPNDLTIDASKNLLYHYLWDQKPWNCIGFGKVYSNLYLKIIHIYVYSIFGISCCQMKK